jgi:hypothetical protein
MIAQGIAIAAAVWRCGPPGRAIKGSPGIALDLALGPIPTALKPGIGSQVGADEKGINQQVAEDAKMLNGRPFTPCGPASSLWLVVTTDLRLRRSEIEASPCYVVTTQGKAGEGSRVPGCFPPFSCFISSMSCDQTVHCPTAGYRWASKAECIDQNPVQTWRLHQKHIGNPSLARSQTICW